MNLMGNLLKKMQSAGVDFSSGSAPDDETKKKLREMGVDVYKKGGKVKSASARADGCAIRGKTRA
jgi:protein-tyrosine-phosphatase